MRVNIPSSFHFQDVRGCKLQVFIGGHRELTGKQQLVVSGSFFRGSDHLDFTHTH